MDPSAYPIQTLDLEFQGEPGVIAAFLVRTSAGPVLVESGPDSTFAALTAALRRAGVEPAEVRHVLLTHIHLDHAGAAWRLASLGAEVHVHPAGAPHLQDPAKLLASARKIYREQMDPLWGVLEPIPADRIRPLADGDVLRFGDVSIEALFTPGHAIHHVTYRLDGAVFTGDVGGVRIDGGPAVAPCPPPDIDVELWTASLDRIRAVRPQVLYLTHFGPFADALEHLDGVGRSLRGLSAWVLERLRAGDGEDALVAGVDAYARGVVDGVASREGLARSYQLANPAFMSAAGLARYWRKSHPEALAGA